MYRYTNYNLVLGKRLPAPDTLSRWQTAIHIIHIIHRIYCWLEQGIQTPNVPLLLCLECLFLVDTLRWFMRRGVYEWQKW